MIPNAGSERLTLEISAADLSNPSYPELELGPLPAVLDTACVRTGLHFQMANGFPPASVQAARTGVLRLFMEYETLVETLERLPKFAKGLKVPEAELRRAFSEDWLPHIEVVAIPSSVREIDPRALGVQLRDADDYPAAALAALLSPCILLTHNYKDFGALGILTPSQGVDGVLALVSRDDCQSQVQASVAVPLIPALAVVSTTKWAAQRIGPLAWAILGLTMAGGALLYRKQSQDTREKISNAAVDVTTFLIEEFTRSAAALHQARERLGACVVPGPDFRSTESAIIRELATSPDSLSAQQIFDTSDLELGLSVTDTRSFLRANEGTLFTQVRRGGFVLGQRYRLAQNLESRAGSPANVLCQ